MTNLEYLQSLPINKFAEWLDEHGQFDGSPWMDWFNETYCKKCESIKCKIKSTNIGITPLYPDREIDCAYCELEHKCKFFENLEDVPDNKEIIKMWLLKSYKEEDL
jgi:hypothetical protein